MARLLRSIRFLFTKCRVVDNEIGVLPHLDRALARPRVSCVDNAATGARGTHDVGWIDASSIKLDGLATVQLPEQRALRHAQLARTRHIKTAQTFVLDQRIA